MSTTTTWPGGATNSTPTAYSVPAAGELNWASLSNFLNALAAGAQSTTFQKWAIRKAIATPVTVSASTDCVIASNLTVPGAVAVTLPAGAAKQVFCILDDKGDAGTNNVTITPNGAETIGGAANLVFSVNKEFAILVYNSTDTDWKVVARGSWQGSPLNNPMTTIGDMIYGGTGGSPQRLPVGTAETWLVSKAGAAPQWLNTVTKGKFIDGSADEIQLRVQGNGTQTALIESVEDSSANVLRSVTGAGFNNLVKGSLTTDAISDNFTIASGTSFTHPNSSPSGTVTVTGTYFVPGNLSITGTVDVTGTVSIYG